jgi:hypothetical protein
MIGRTLFTLVVGVLSVAASAQAPQEAMEAVAAKLGFGAKRADSITPQPTSSGFGARVSGYYQCFERGCVYFAKDIGVLPVSGPIFTRWVEAGYERGPLGFPMSRQRQCSIPAVDPRSEYQDFEGGSIVLSGTEPRTTTVIRGRRINKTGNCTLTTGPMTTERPAARFRISLNGFACHRATYDDATQRDGVDDEVFVDVIARLVDSATGGIGQPGRGTPPIGDTNGQPGRIRGGSGSSIVGGNGGFRDGDTFPAGGTPWIRTMTPAPEQIPLLVWEGTLVDGVNAAVLLPSLWEEDSGTSLRTPFSLAVGAGALDELGTRVIGRSSFSYRFVSDLRPAFDSVRMNKDSAGPGTRPIGMKDRGTYYAAEPTALAFNYETAMRLATSSNDGLPQGVFTLEVRDAPQLKGLYTLYFQIEVVP